MLRLVPPAESFAYSRSIIISTVVGNKCDGRFPSAIMVSRGGGGRDDGDDEDDELSMDTPSVHEVDLCIIGGGISGLTAAITAAKNHSTRQSSGGASGTSRRPPPPLPLSILVLESDSAVGGRVRSDITDDGFVLDRGFAVFVEEYPRSKELLDYDALELGRFLPGARVKLEGRERLASVSDPLRRRRDVLRAIASPVGTPRDKLRLAPLFYAVMTKSVEELFAMEETDALSCLRDTYGFSEGFVDSFFAPFLEGIYLAPLECQSSRMFHFVMKMVAVGSTSLPLGGMQAVADQLGDTARGLGAEIRLGSGANSVTRVEDDDDDDGGTREYLVEIDSQERGKRTVRAKCVVVATDVHVAGNILRDAIVPGSGTEAPPPPTQRTVGCLYYGFRSPAPLADPILVLNGEGRRRRNTREFPVNNVCFPSVVQRGYAPDGFELCSVAVLERALSEHGGDIASLDAAARKQLSTWFPNHADDILDESKWVRKGSYVVDNAQPSHYGGDGCANVHGGRDCSVFRGATMPAGMFVCGDHMATSTFNGALESGVNAGNAAAGFLAEP